LSTATRNAGNKFENLEYRLTQGIIPSDTLLLSPSSFVI